MSTNKPFHQLIDAFTFHNLPLLASAVVTFAFGFLEYVYALRLVCREGKGPFPIWIHTLYLAHDSSWAIRTLIAASHNDWNWFLVSIAIALFVYNGFEIFNIYHAVVHERQDVWGKYLQGKAVTTVDAIGYVLIQLAAFYTLVNVLINFMGQDSIFQWFALTNVAMAAGPGLLWRSRRSREGTSVGLAIVIVVATIYTFVPTSMFILALPEVFNKTWYYLAGVVFTAISISSMIYLLSLPPKKSRNGKQPIW